MYIHCSEHQRKALGMVEGEDVLIQTRRHWLSLMPPFLVFFILFWVAVVFWSYDEFLAFSDQARYLIAVGIFVFGAALFSRMVIFWAYEVYAITSKRIFSFGLRSGFRYESETVIFELIKTMESKKPSFFASLFNYGNVVIGVDNYGAESVFKMRWVPDPDYLLNQINQHNKPS